MYTPLNVPQDPAQIPAFLRNELSRIARAYADTVPLLALSALNAPPKQIREGLIVLADGTNWNPGSGSGFYGYRAGAWRFLG